jgi:diguanylate cyclase
VTLPPFLPEVRDATRELPELLAQTLELGVASRLVDHPRAGRRGEGPGASACALPRHPPRAALRTRLKALWLKIELQGGNPSVLQQGLLKLLRLLVENVSELVMDDQWLHGQIAAVRQAISEP